MLPAPEVQGGLSNNRQHSDNLSSFILTAPAPVFLSQNRRVAFDKCRQLFIRTHNKTLILVAMRAVQRRLFESFHVLPQRRITSGLRWTQLHLGSRLADQELWLRFARSTPRWP